MKARNEFETATNTIEASLVVEELSDADLTAINGGSGYVTESELGSGLGLIGDGLGRVLAPVVGGVLGLVAR